MKFFVRYSKKWQPYQLSYPSSNELVARRYIFLMKEMKISDNNNKNDNDNSDDEKNNQNENDYFINHRISTRISNPLISFSESRYLLLTDLVEEHEKLHRGHKLIT